MAMNFIAELAQQMVLASVPAVGFGMVFNVPRRILGLCAAGGALGRGLRFALHDGCGLPLEWSTLLAAAAVSLLGVVAAQRIRAHPKVMTVAAMIPMIPGVPLFTTLIALAQIQRGGSSPELLATVFSQGIKSAIIVAALAVGLALPGMLFYRRRPVV
jgi:uncharacterized membrane protein YjjB (DUF3815 family)